MSLQCQSQVQRLCFGRELFTSVYMLICVYICEELFCQTWSPNLALALQHRFLNWHLTDFGKELFIYTPIRVDNTHIDAYVKGMWPMLTVYLFLICWGWHGSCRQQVSWSVSVVTSNQCFWDEANKWLWHNVPYLYSYYVYESHIHKRHGTPIN